MVLLLQEHQHCFLMELKPPCCDGELCVQPVYFVGRPVCPQNCNTQNRYTWKASIEHDAATEYGPCGCVMKACTALISPADTTWQVDSAAHFTLSALLACLLTRDAATQASASHSVDGSTISFRTCLS